MTGKHSTNAVTKIWAHQKEYWTLKLLTFAVVQFAFYMFVFYGLYRLEPELMTKSNWRVMTLIALLAGIYTSLVPAEIHDKWKHLKDQDDFSEGYLCIGAPFAIFIIIFLGHSFYNWTFDVTHNQILWFCISYLVVAPIFGSLVKQ